MKQDEKFEIRVPVHLTSNLRCEESDGVLEINTHLLRIRVLPKDLPEAIPVDVHRAKVGETFKVGSLKPIPGLSS